MASITVCGSASVDMAPDQAVLALTCSVLDSSATAATTEASRRTNVLASVLTSLGFEGDDWSSHGISVQEEWQWRDNTNTRIGFRATIGATVQIVHFDRIAALIERAVAEADATVSSFEWSVSDTNPARTDLLGAAAADAAKRAATYAAALGLSLGAIEDVSDLPLSGTPRWPEALRMAKTADAAPMELNAGRVRLSASVYVRFAAE